MLQHWDGENDTEMVPTRCSAVRKDGRELPSTGQSMENGGREKGEARTQLICHYGRRKDSDGENRTKKCVGVGGKKWMTVCEDV